VIWWWSRGARSSFLLLWRRDGKDGRVLCQEGGLGLGSFKALQSLLPWRGRWPKVPRVTPTRRPRLEDMGSSQGSWPFLYCGVRVTIRSLHAYGVGGKSPQEYWMVLDL